MAFEPATLQSKLGELCRELGCPPGTDMVEWIADQIITLRQDQQELTVLCKNQNNLLETAKEILAAAKEELEEPIRGTLFSEGPKFFINIEMGIEIGFEGYGVCNGARGSELSSAPIYIEYHQGQVVLYVWDNINDKDYSHKISLEGARESNRSESIDEET